jgi:hypothetical protein
MKTYLSLILLSGHSWEEGVGVDKSACYNSIPLESVSWWNIVSLLVTKPWHLTSWREGARSLSSDSGHDWTVLLVSLLPMTRRGLPLSKGEINMWFHPHGSNKPWLDNRAGANIHVCPWRRWHSRVWLLSWETIWPSLFFSSPNTGETLDVAHRIR